jgi:hypothetical protein
MMKLRLICYWKEEPYLTVQIWSMPTILTPPVYLFGINHNDLPGILWGGSYCVFAYSRAPLLSPRDIDSIDLNQRYQEQMGVGW